MDATHAQPDRDARRAIGWLAVSMAGMLMASTLPTPLYSLYRREFGFSEFTLTVVYAVYAIGNLTSLLLLGRLSDQIGRRRTAIAAFVTAAASTACYLLATGTSWLFPARILSGIGIGLFSGAVAAWIADLVPGHDSTRASATVTVANYAGLLAGPLAAGVLAEYVPKPLRISYVVLLALLGACVAVLFAVPETVRTAVRWSELSLRPRIGVGKELRAAFVAPAVTAFATFALVGFYAALAPTVLREQMRVMNMAASGAVVGELFLCGAVAVAATIRVGCRAAMLGSLVLLLVALGVLVAAYLRHSLPILLLGTAVTGISAAVGFRGSLEVVTQIAPEEQRAEVLSTYFVAGYLGNALPVIGVGLLTRLAGAAIADLVLCLTVALLAVVALITGIVFRAPPDSRSQG